MKLPEIARAEEQALTDEQLIRAKDDIELLVKLICYVGREHPKVEEIANRIYDTWGNHEPVDNRK